jgi:hypothetical protein
MAAGCLFTDGKTVLAGLQEKNEKLVLSGFGGKIEETDETIVDAGIREALEELLHIQPPAELVRYLMVHYIPRNSFKNGDYTVFVYGFDDLIDFLHICLGFGVSSPLYDVFPKDLLSLLLNRKILLESEVRQLALLPVCEGVEFCEYFLSDLKMYSRL